jgi:tetratricopeptide (TPR) repeat protein
VTVAALVCLPAAALAMQAAKPAPPKPASSRPATPAAPARSGAGFDTTAAAAAKAREAGRLDEAATLYRRGLELRPSWLEGRWALATLLYDQDRFAEAAKQFERLVQAAPRDGQALALRGLCRLRLGEREAALEDLMAARALGIQTAEVRSVATYNAAALLNALGDPDSAFEVLRPFAIEGDDRPPVVELFGLITLRMPLLPGEVPEDKRDMVLLAGHGGYHQARVHRDELGRMALEELISRYPGAPNVHYALGMYLLVDDPDEAIEEFHRELVTSPDHHVAMIQLALAEMRRGRAQEALPFAAKAALLAPNVPAARLVHGRALLDTNRAEEAVRELEAAVKLAPESAKLRFSLARAYTQAGRTEDAARERAEFQKLQKSSGNAGRTEIAEDGDPAPPRDR